MWFPLSMSQYLLDSVSMKYLLVLALFVGSGFSDPYVPGTPGGPWTQAEVQIVKAKLFSLFNRGGAWKALTQLYGQGNVDGSDPGIPKTAKFLRLGFHDCLRYTDGSGGCDGCLNWHGVGTRFTEPHHWKYPNVGKTDNNGLRFTVEVLEGVYTDPCFPDKIAPCLDVSLKDSGKSRADLWALAAIAAVEYGVETNRMICDGTYNDNPKFQCNEDIGQDNCQLELPRSFVFKTGRKDCTEFGDQPYIATKNESHPNAVGNGRKTMDFFKSDFGFTGRETVAIFGAHTMGKFHDKVSLHRYTWTFNGGESFNNLYYKNIVRADKYGFYNDGNDVCKLMTDAEGRKPKTRWLVKVQTDTENGGPVQWQHQNYICTNCDEEPDDPCCINVPEGQACNADSVDIEDDPSVNTGCERFRTITLQNERAMSSEIGLYFDFNVTDDGIPYGCPGFEEFTAAGFNESQYYRVSRVKGMRSDPLCPFNTMEEPAGSTPLHQIFEEYAASQEAFARDFVPALEKMLSNGYNEDELTTGPDQATNIVCPRGEPGDSKIYTNCYNQELLQGSPRFAIVSDMDGRALEVADDGSVVLMTLDESNPHQMFQETDVGNQWINVGTGTALKVQSSARSWFTDDKGRIRNHRYPNKVIQRSSEQVDGASVTMANKKGANDMEDQKWILQQL